jgi:acylphosphatase
MSNIRIMVQVTGRVQGVSFRYATFRKALALGTTGWVKNLPDGSVQTCIEGDEATVNQLLNWLHDGPPSARVDQVKVDRQEYVGQFEKFEILR